MDVRPEDRAARAATELKPSLGFAWLALAVGGVLVLAIAGHNAKPMDRGAQQSAPPTAKPALFVAPTVPALPTPATQAAAFAPGEAKSAKVPLGLTPRYQDSRMPGWVGVDWDGAILWVEGDGTGLQDLAPKTGRGGAPEPPQPVYAPASLPAPVSTIHEKPHDETR